MKSFLVPTVNFGFDERLFLMLLLVCCYFCDVVTELLILIFRDICSVGVWHNVSVTACVGACVGAGVGVVAGAGANTNAGANIWCECVCG